MSKSKKTSPLFNKPLGKEIQLDIQDGSYFYTRGGWSAKVVHVCFNIDRCYVIHNPGTPYEVGPVAHEVKSGHALTMSLFPLLEPPAYTGHPADLVKEMEVS